MRLPPIRIDGKRVAASSLDRRTAGFKLGDGRECQRLAKRVSRLRGNDSMAQKLNPPGIRYKSNLAFSLTHPTNWCILYS